MVVWRRCSGGGVRMCDWSIQTGVDVTKAGRNKYGRATLYNTINTRPGTGRKSSYYYKHPADSVCVCVCVSHAVTSCHKDVTNGKTMKRCHKRQN